MYKLYLLDLKELNDDNTFLFFFNKLNKVQKEKVKEYSLRKKQNILLSEYLLYNYFFSNEEFFYNQYGKPYLKNKYFNISHADNYLLLGIADEEIGVDMQKITFKKNVEKLFSEEEQNLLKTAKEKMFTRYWVLKESYAKYLGVGISKKILQETIKKKDVYFYEYEDLNGYMIAVCLKNKYQKEKINYLTLNKLGEHDEK